jgi:hypothetical protein
MKSFKEFIVESNMLEYKKLDQYDIDCIFDVLSELKEYDYEFVKTVYPTGTDNPLPHQIKYKSKYPSEIKYTGNCLEFSIDVSDISIEVKKLISELYETLLNMKYTCYYYTTGGGYLYFCVSTPESWPDSKSETRIPFK